MKRLKSLEPHEQQPPQAKIVEGEIIARNADARFVVRLDDGRTLSNCFISSAGRRTKQNSVMPGVGERIWVEVSPFDANTGRTRLPYRTQS